MPDYIPTGDAAFDSWAENFVAYAAAHRPQLGLTFAQITALTTARTAWKTAYTAHVAAQATAQGARAGKDTSRAALEAAIRPLVRRLQAAVGVVTDDEKAALGITIPDTTATPAAAPTTRPVVTIDARHRLQHTIAFADETTPARVAKPAGVVGAEIWLAVTPPGAAPPSDPGAFRFVALDTRTPYTLNFDGADGGNLAHYLLRWATPRAAPGPWSQTATATIGA